MNTQEQPTTFINN